jgi:phage anti-repressor protein
MADLVLRGQVETLYQQAQGSEQEFCIDLEGEAPDDDDRPVWEWMEYSTKGSAIRSLGKLVEGVDYQLTEVLTASGGTPRQIVRFSLEGFKQWGMLAGTERGRQIRLYFIECEKRLQLGMSQPTTMNGALEKILERQQALAEDMSCMFMHGINGVRADIGDVRVELGDVRERVARLEEQQCDQLYVFVRSKDLTIKLGHTIDLDQRRKHHERRGFCFVGAVSGTRKRESQIKESLKHRGFLPKNGTEEFQLCPEIVEAFNHEGLPIGDLSLAKPQTACGSQRRKKADPMMLTPMLF